MNLSKILWNLFPKDKKQFLLEAMGPLEFRQFKKMMSGESSLPDAFLSKKLLFVHIPKTAGSSIYDLFFDGGKGLGHMPYAWYQRIAPDFCDEVFSFSFSFSFSFVRNPWDRLVSAFHFVLDGGAPRRDGALSKVFSRYKCFDDFVMNWVNDENINSNLHFIPQYKFLLNRNGEIGVDFVGHYERLNSDLEKICKAAGLPSSNIVSLKKINPSSRGNYRHYYTERSAEVVMNLYKKDIELFGYGY